MNKQEVIDAIISLWVLVHESSPVIIGSQSLHGKFPDVADSLIYSREVDVVLPNKAKLGRWLSDVVGDGTPFSSERGYYIDHVIPVDGLPILATGWEERSIREKMVYNGEVCGEIKYISPEDLAIAKLGASRPKDFEFVKELFVRNYINIKDVERLIDEVPEKYQGRVKEAFEKTKLWLPKDNGISSVRPIHLPSFDVGQKFNFMAMDQVVANGYRGTVAKVLDGQLEGMVEVHLPGGVACVAASFPDCFPAYTNGVEVVTEGHFVGSVLDVSGQFVVQDAGRGRLVAHECHRFENLPAVGDSIDLQHRGGKVVFSVEKDKGRGNER